MKYRFTTALDLDFKDMTEGAKLYESYKDHVDLWFKAHPDHVKHIGHKDLPRRGDEPIDMDKMQFRRNR